MTYSLGRLDPKAILAALISKEVPDPAVFVRAEAIGWSVVPGDGPPLATFRSPADAIVFGRDFAQRHQTKLVVQSPDGLEHFSESYASE